MDATRASGWYPIGRALAFIYAAGWFVGTWVFTLVSFAIISPQPPDAADRVPSELATARVLAAGRLWDLLGKWSRPRTTIFSAGLGLARLRSRGSLLAGPPEPSRARRRTTCSGRGRGATHSPQRRDRGSDLGRVARTSAFASCLTAVSRVGFSPRSARTRSPTRPRSHRARAATQTVSPSPFRRHEWREG